MDRDNLGHGEPHLKDVVAVADRIVALGDSFAATIRFIDTATGATWTELAWLGPDGTAHEGAPLLPGEDRAVLEQVSDSGFDGLVGLAASVQPMSPGVLEWIAETLKEAAPEGLLTLASGATMLAAVTGDPVELDGMAQKVLLLRWGGEQPPRSTALDLGPLGLSAQRFVTLVAIHSGVLHATVADPIGGFDVFAASADAEEPRFRTVLTGGADRFAINAAVSAAASHPKGLLLGTAALAPGPAAKGSWGPELLLLRPDGTWEIVFGQPRFTPDGLKHPVSGRLPGLGNVANAAVKVVASGETTHVLLQDFAGTPVETRRDALPDFLDYMGPTRVFRSSDLRDWEEVPIAWTNEMGAVAALVVTETGMLVGHEGLAENGLPITFLAHS